MQLEPAQIREALSIYGVSPSFEQIEKIQLYVAMILKWNRSVSLTSIAEPNEIARRHFGESMFVAKLTPVENCRLADVGTGAGFPGLALKIACPSLKLILLDSNKKKCAFLAEVVRELGFQDVEIRSERFEDLRPETFHADLITSRAVGNYTRLLGWSQDALADRGHLVLWVGGEDSTRIAAVPGWIWQPAIRIPDSQRRYILIGRPLAQPSQRARLI